MTGTELQTTFVNLISWKYINITDCPMLDCNNTGFFKL